MSLFIKLLGDGVKSLLTGGVPYFYINFIKSTRVVLLTLGLNRMLILCCYVVNTDGFNVRLLEFVISKSKRMIKM